MARAKCFRCYGAAEASTFEEAAKRINHAVGLSRGKPCGANYNAIRDVTPKDTISKSTLKSTLKPTTKSTPKSKKTKTETKEKTKESTKETVTIKNNTFNLKP